MYKVDLHTHSMASPDGGLRPDDYRKMLALGKLDYIAVTDHNSIELALELHKSLGARIIVGEEIKAQEGEVIGLYLHKAVPAGLSVAQTIQAIHEQGGLVYIPHPFETIRSGVPLELLDAVAEQVDVIETINGRAVLQKNLSKQAGAWAKAHHMPEAASSDAHGKHGWGKTYSLVAKKPTRENLVELLQGAKYQAGFPGVRGVLYPKYNRFQKKLKNA